MTLFDVFNGDADGLCARHQLRLASPAESVLVTGVKRDIELLARVDAGKDDEVAVLDISLDRNRNSLVRVLEAGASVRYFDHHYPGAVPAHDRLTACIDQSPDTCTSLLVDRYIGGLYRSWAIVGAFGDNLTTAGFTLAAAHGFSAAEAAMLQTLGQLLNYNSYGDDTADLCFDPSELAALLTAYEDPLDFFKSSTACRTLAERYELDMDRAARFPLAFESANVMVITLPDEPWSRRIRGVLANLRMSANPSRALAVLSPNGDGYTVSVRASLANPFGADQLCRQFENGGGRAAAAGIDHLPKTEVDLFISRLSDHFARNSG